MRNTSTNNNYPKTLLIRNTIGGMVWQLYHVNNELEALRLSNNAQNSAFKDQELTDYNDQEETFPNWRQESNGIIEDQISI